MSKPQSILETAETGSHRDLLVSLRDYIPARMDEGVSARDLVGLSRRLIDSLSRCAPSTTATSPKPRVVHETFDPAAIRCRRLPRGGTLQASLWALRGVGTPHTQGQIHRSAPPANEKTS